MTKTKNIRLFQIYYDQDSRLNLQSGFEPLDNCNGPPEFREIVPIVKYLKENDIQNHEWLGFFSPKFGEKTGLGATDVSAEVTMVNDDIDACLFTSHWSQIAFFQNAWEHGEYCHPGLIGACQTLADRAGYNLDLTTSVSSLNNSVFSHFLVANGRFWREWCRIVEIYLKLITENDDLFMWNTVHDYGTLSMHPFVVERVPSLIFQDSKFNAKVSNRVIHKSNNLINDILNPQARWRKNQTNNMSDQLLMADRMKELYLATGERKYLDEYWRFRLWAPVESGYVNLTECAMNYIRANCVNATVGGLKIRDRAA